MNYISELVEHVMFYAELPFCRNCKIEVDNELNGTIYNSTNNWSTTCMDCGESLCRSCYFDFDGWHYCGVCINDYIETCGNACMSKRDLSRLKLIRK